MKTANPSDGSKDRQLRQASRAEETIEVVRRNWRAEVETAQVYRELAEREQDEKRKGILLRMAEAEERHAQRWEKKLRDLGAEPPVLENTLRRRRNRWVEQDWPAPLSPFADGSGRGAARGGVPRPALTAPWPREKKMSGFLERAPSKRKLTPVHECDGCATRSANRARCDLETRTLAWTRRQLGGRCDLWRQRWTGRRFRNCFRRRRRNKQPTALRSHFWLGGNVGFPRFPWGPAPISRPRAKRKSTKRKSHGNERR